MLSVNQLGDSGNIDRRVDEFFDTIAVRDSEGAVVEVLLSEMEFDLIRNGRKPPTVPVQLQDKLSKFFAPRRIDNCQTEVAKLQLDVMKLQLELMTQYPKRISGPVRARAADGFWEKQKALSFVDQLKLSACTPESNPTEATLVARMYLDGTSDTPRDPEYARELLIHAADRGNAEAAYLLATSRNVSDIHRRLKAPLVVSPFLMEDAKQRQQYLHQARTAKYQRVFDNEEESRRNQALRERFIDSELPDGLAERLERDPDYIEEKESYKANLKSAQIGDASAQCKVGKALLDMADSVIRVILFAPAKYPERPARDPELVELAQKTKSNEEEARTWLLKASKQSCEAKYILAKRFSESNEQRFALLVSAAFPEGGLDSYRLALSPLACEFYMNPASKYHDVENGLKCLNVYLSYYSPMTIDLHVELLHHGDLYGEANGSPLGRNQSPRFGLVPEDAEAAVCLADYWRNTLPGTEQQLLQSYIWYRALAYNVPNSAYAALQAGLMVKRGEGLKQNLEDAKRLLEIARDAESTDVRNTRVSKYADVVLRLGFEPSSEERLAVEQLLELVEETDCDDGAVCPITPADVKCWSVKDPPLKEYLENIEEYRRDIGRNLASYDRLVVGRFVGAPTLFGAFPHFGSITHGLLWTLQPHLDIPRDVLAKLWTDEPSMVKSYVKALLEMGGRLTPVDRGARTRLVEQHLKDAIDMGERILDSKNARPPKFADREMAIWIIQRARQRLDSLNALRIVEERAKTKYESMKAVAEERARNLSTLAHTLHNALGTGPEIVRTAVRNLSVRKRDLTPLESKAVNDLVSLYTTFEFVERLIQSFKLRVANPEKLSADMMAEHPGLPSMGDLVAQGLHQVVARALFKSNAPTRFHLAGSRDEKKLKSLLSDFRRQLFLDDNSINGQTLAEWANSHLPGLRVNFSADVFCHPLHNHTQHALLFTIVSELLLNAVQHAGPSSPIDVSLVAEGPIMKLTVRNAFAGNGGKESIKIGSGGLSFIEALVGSLDVPGLFEANFQWEVVNGFFIASLLLTDERERQHEHNMGGRLRG